MRLGSVTFFAHDVDALASFYADALGLEHSVDDTPRFREVSGGGAKIGFAFRGAYELLALDEDAAPTGLRSILTFVLPEAAAMGPAIARATRCGATIAKEPYRSHFGAMLAVLRDPEGNAFRFSAEPTA